MRLFIVFSLLILAGCATYPTAADIKAYSHDKCVDYGFVSGTTTFAACRMQVSQNVIQRSNARRMYNARVWQRALNGMAESYEVNRTTCSSFGSAPAPVGGQTPIYSATTNCYSY